MVPALLTAAVVAAAWYLLPRWWQAIVAPLPPVGTVERDTHDDDVRGW